MFTRGDPLLSGRNGPDPFMHGRMKNETRIAGIFPLAYHLGMDGTDRFRNCSLSPAPATPPHWANLSGVTSRMS